MGSLSYLARYTKLQQGCNRGRLTLSFIFSLHVGDEVPDSWKGKLDITYRIGNKGFIENNTAIRIDVNFPNTRQDIYNVIGTIYGKEEPDRWVLIGNHRDAWGFGAVDPSSGTATMMEISRGLGILLKQGINCVFYIVLHSWLSLNVSHGPFCWQFAPLVVLSDSTCHTKFENAP